MFNLNNRPINLMEKLAAVREGLMAKGFS